jgi:hypothetical protein
MAMLKLPVVLLASAEVPTAVLWVPVVVAVSASEPTAVLAMPVVRESSARLPNDVFAPWAPHALGHCAWSGGESANQQSAIATVKKPQRKGERLIDVIRVFIFLFISLEVALLKT